MTRMHLIMLSRAQGSVFRAQGSEFHAQGSEFCAQGIGFRAQGSESRAQAIEFHAQEIKSLPHLHQKTSSISQMPTHTDKNPSQSLKSSPFCPTIWIGVYILMI